MSKDSSLVTANAPDSNSHDHDLANTTAEVPAYKIVRKLISGMGEGGLLLLLTCLSYSLAYCYKVGQYRAFNLPLFLVSIDLNDCLRAGTAILSGVFTLFIFLNIPFFARNFVTFKQVTWKYLCLFVLFLFSAYSILSILFEVPWASFLMGVAIVAVFLLVVIGTAELSLKFKSKSKSHTLEYNDLFDWLRQALGKEIFMFLMFLPAISFFVEKLGYSNARKQHDFFQISGTQLVLIDATSTGLICKSIEDGKSRLRGGFTILSGDELAKLTFENKSFTAWNQGTDNSASPTSKGADIKLPSEVQPKTNPAPVEISDPTVPASDSSKPSDLHPSAPVEVKPKDPLAQ